MKLFCLIALIAPLFSCISIPEEELKSPPEKEYSYYSGSQRHGNYYCKIQEFKHQKTGKAVSLIGMIHIADQSFYDLVDKHLDTADLVLEEGVYGLPSFGINKYFSLYSFSIINRLTPIQGLVPQSQALKHRDNSESADMSIDQLSSEGSLFTPLIQLLSMPFMIIASEPYLLYYNGKTSMASVFSEEWRQQIEADLRHEMLLSMHMTDQPAKVLIPGIIDARNKLLLEKLDDAIKREDIHSIAIPWGADHMPSLEKDLIESGYSKTNKTKWLRSIAVKDYLESGSLAENKVESWGLPYIYTAESYRNHASTSVLFSSIKLSSSNSHERFSLLWGDLFDHIRFANGSYHSFLPRIAGKPIFFDLAQKGKKQRLRFLWFFSIGSLGDE